MFVIEEPEVQIQKTDIKNSILRVAGKEFLKRGFRNTNMRVIADQSGISLGNIYNYFPNKNAIFYETVRPAVDFIEQAFILYENMEIIEDEYSWGLEYHKEFIKDVADFIDAHRKNLQLILFYSQGTSLENYKEDFISRYTKIMICNVKNMRDAFPDAISNISDFFLHTIASMHANVITEIVMHDLSHDEMLFHLNELMMFLFSGWDTFIDKKKIFPDQDMMTGSM